MGRLGFVLALFGLLLGARPAHGQRADLRDRADTTIERMVVFSPAVRERLDAYWNDRSPTQTERGFCLRAVLEVWPTRYQAIVYDVEPARMHFATPYASAFECPVDMIELHTHPPTTCTVKDKDEAVSDCGLGGVDAFNCAPSRADRAQLTAHHRVLAVVQCDRRALVPFWNTAWEPPALVVPPALRSKDKTEYE